MGWVVIIIRYRRKRWAEALHLSSNFHNSIETARARGPVSIESAKKRLN
jgi:hypothetical protein